MSAEVNEEIKCAERLLNSADRPAAFPGTDRDQLKVQAPRSGSMYGAHVVVF